MRKIYLHKLLDSLRSSDTLEIVTNKQISYQRLKGLKEEYFGSFEGQDERLNPQVPYNDFFVQYGGEDQKTCKSVYLIQFQVLWLKPTPMRKFLPSHMLEPALIS